MEYFIEAIVPTLLSGPPVEGIKIVTLRDRPHRVFGFVGIDGDDTGRQLERLFAEDASPAAFSEYSNAVRAAMDAVWLSAKKSLPKAKQIFIAGDDLFFSAEFSYADLVELQSVYGGYAGHGRTCSIGFGSTPLNTFVALKMAKSREGKASIVGVHVEHETK